MLWPILGHSGHVYLLRHEVSMTQQQTPLPTERISFDVELAPTPTNSSRPPIAHPFPFEFVEFVKLSADDTIDKWVSAYAPPNIQRLYHLRALAREYCDAHEYHAGAIPAYIHAQLLAALPRGLELLIGDGASFETTGGALIERKEVRA